MDFFVTLYQEIFFKPLFNGLIGLTAVLPFHDLGLAIIILTILVRFIIFPFTHRSIITQIKMKEIEPHIRNIREQFKNNQAEIARKTMELYKEHGVSPFSGCLLVIAQFPVLIALYHVFLNEIAPRAGFLYSFIQFPDTINMSFLGLINLGHTSIVIALLAAASQFIQMRLAIPPKPAQKVKKEENSKPDFSSMFSSQAQYIFPFFIFFISFRFPAALGLYWTTSNIFAILHESLVRRKARLFYDRQGKADTNPKNNIVTH